MSVDPTLLDWMLNTDSALRWQVERDLAGASPEVWQATRARVATEGFGRRLLDHQDADGQWAGGAYFPAGFFDLTEEERGPGQPYTATTWSLSSLREWGVDAAVLAGTAEKLAANCSWEYEGLPYWDGEVDVCINSWTLSNGVWLGLDMSALAAWFVEHQMPEGGWNCEWVEGSTRSSFHSTLNALRGLLDYEIATGGNDEIRAARHAGEEYLLQRRLMYKLSTGEEVDYWVAHFAYPFRWYYSVLNAVDYFRSSAQYEGAAPDARLTDAVEAIRHGRRDDGSWLQERRHPGAVWFEIDVAPGLPSPWLTLVGTRALDWWDAQQPAVT